MFWGLIIKEGKKYSKVVEQEFKLTNAALDLTNQSGDVQVLLTAQDVTYLLCTLNRQVPQTLLNKRFASGEEICFALKGKGAVHLTGNIIEDAYDFDEEMEDEEDEDEQLELANGGGAKGDRESKKAAKAKVAQKIASGQVSSDEDEDDATFNASGLDDSALNGGEGDSSEDEEDDEEDEDSEDDGGEDDEEEDEDDDEEEDEEDDDDDDEEEDEQPKAKQAKLSHDAKSATQNGNAKAKESKDPKDAAKKQQQQSNDNNPAVRKLQDGLIVEDIKVGSGPEAKPGKKVAVYYVGRLKQNNKVFDSTSSGAGFKFALGRGEVIKGWDLGVAGMKVGGKRRLTIPHKLAYGTKGSPPVIPPCSTLVFEVELKKVL